MDQYWICKKKILRFVFYFIGILSLFQVTIALTLITGVQKRSCLSFLIPADSLCFQTFALLRVGEKLSAFLALCSSLSQPS